MVIRKVARLGHPVLRQKAGLVLPQELRLDATQQLIDDMVETMREYEGVGLAAPQVHVSKRIFVVEIEAHHPRYPEAPEFELLIVVNPELTLLDNAWVSGWEGCLSIPGLKGSVPRCGKVHLKALDRNGRTFEKTLVGFAAVVTQHEYDHLDGIVYLDRMPDLSSLCYDHEYERYWTKQAEEVAETITK